jgi:hypothetical protein
MANTQINDEALRRVAEWLDSCLTRFKNMSEAGLDENGYPAIQKALSNYQDKGYFTVGEIQYLFNRTHPKGKYSTYNTHKGYNKKYGNMMECPLKDIIDANIVNWRTGTNGVIQNTFANTIKAETAWEFRAGTLRARYDTTFNDLFGEP